MDTTLTKLARNGLSTTEENSTPEQNVGLTTNLIKTICGRGYRKSSFDLATEHYLSSISVRGQKVNRIAGLKT